MKILKKSWTSKLLGVWIAGFFGALLPAYASAEIFFVNTDFESVGKNKIEASLETVGQDAYFFVENDYRSSLPKSEVARLNRLVLDLSYEFDSNIYPKLREVFGGEANPGIDNNPKITVLLHNMKPGIGGYTRDQDQSIAVDSNRREMLYLNVEEVLNNEELGPSYVAHEFQHLITFNQKNLLRGVSEEKWLNEARSEYAPTAAGYSEELAGSYLKKRAGEFMSYPSEPLIDWRGRSADHASASMFIHYLADRYGTDIFKEMIFSDKIGAESIEDAISKMGHKESFKDVFADWLVAVYVNSSTDNENEIFKYKFANLSFGNLHVLPTSLYRTYGNYSKGANYVIDNWSAQWHRFVPGSLGEETTLRIKLSFDDPRNFLAPYIVSDFLGGTEVKFFEASEGAIISVSEFGNFVSSVVVVPVMASSNEEVGSFSIEGFVSNSFADKFAEGALVRVAGDPKVYIIKNGSRIRDVYARWIQTEEVFGFYNHFTWADIIEIKPALLAGFKESFLIRKAGDYKVYEVDKFGRKKWLDITAEEFEASGRNWDSIYEVNGAEFAWYLKNSKSLTGF